MKRLIITLLATLIVLYAALAALGRGGEYAAEKLFYHTMKNASTISLNPDAAPPAQLASVENDLKLLLKKYPDTRTARLAYIGLLEFYVANKRYDDVMALAKVIEKAYSGDVQILSTIQFVKGVAYEKQNKWDSAVAEFKILKEKYPETQLGIQIPIYIGKYYDSKGMDSQAREAYRDAAAFYTNMEREYSGKVLGYTASILLIQTYLNLKDYEPAGKALEDTLRGYASALAYRQLIPLVETIYVNKLNNYKKAIEIYETLKEKVRNEKLKKFLQKKIETLETKK